jgi:hypothetical protein
VRRWLLCVALAAAGILLRGCGGIQPAFAQVRHAPEIPNFTHNKATAKEKRTAYGETARCGAVVLPGGDYCPESFGNA